MSRATELAEKEAQAAEREEADVPERVEQESDALAPEPQPEGLTEEQADAAFKALERLNERHAREVEKRNAAGVGLVPCPCCNNGTSPVAGYIFPELGEPAQSARRQAVSEALGGIGQVAYREHPTEARCDVCDGLGMLHTGSLVPNQENLPCTGCGGTGHRPKLAPPPPASPVPVLPHLASGATTTTGAQATDDQWGRPLGHPHYNVPPAQVAV